MAADSEKAEPLDLENQEFLPDENTNALKTGDKMM
jgi:hypothetical protein